MRWKHSLEILESEICNAHDDHDRKNLQDTEDMFQNAYKGSALKSVKTSTPRHPLESTP